MKKFIIAGLVILSLIILVVVFAFLFGNNESNIENIYNQTLQSLDNGGSGMKDLFLEDAKKYNRHLDENIDELNNFYQGKSQSVDGLTIYHETDNLFRAYATVTTDKDKYFLCISATGSRYVDAKGIKQIIIEKESTFKGKKVLKNHILKNYVNVARILGPTVRTPGDHNKYKKENEEMKKLMEKDK